ncbi:MAG: tyrosine-type recombinase/integrase [Janthinobacterium lividum]
MTKRLLFIESRKDSVRNWPFQPPPFDRNPNLSSLEKTALATWKAHGHLGHGSKAFKKEIKQQLNRLILPIEAALLHCGVSKGKERLLACVLLLLHEMHRRQTSLWAWDDVAWIEIAGKTHGDFENIHHTFQDAHHISDAHYRQYILACAYLLGEIPIYQLVTGYNALVSAQRIFGGVAVEKALHTLTTESVRIGRGINSYFISTATCSALLANRSPVLEKLTLPVLEKLYENYSHRKAFRSGYVLISTLLHNIKIISNCLPAPNNGKCAATGINDTLSADWARLIQAWYDTSTNIVASRYDTRVSVAKAARWAAEKYPATANAQQWTRSMAIAYVAAVKRMNVGQWQHPKTKSTPNRGKPLKAGYQAQLLGDLRLFFSDCHEWEWFPMAFNPDRYLATPKSILAMRGPNPRAIANAQWAKLREAGLSLTEKDFPIVNSAMVKRANVTPASWYPLDMMRAMAVVWLYTGLRSDEICRLRVGCIRPISREENDSNFSSTPTLCSLTVPIGKSNVGSSKPVDRLVGDAIETWEQSRPAVPKHWDYKTAEAVHFLFVWRGKRVGPLYLNRVIIPVLCRKAGIPIEDALGKITSHRARHTIANQLSNAPTPMSDSDLQKWFGHISSTSLRYYTTANEGKLIKAYATANHTSLDKRQLEQLKKPNAIGNNLATESESIPSFDLGNGLCTYDFFAQCNNQTSCAKCSFFKPKISHYSQMLEAKNNFLHILHSLPLSQEARQASEEGIAAYETLLNYLRNNE